MNRQKIHFEIRVFDFENQTSEIIKKNPPILMPPEQADIICNWLNQAANFPGNIRVCFDYADKK